MESNTALDNKKEDIFCQDKFNLVKNYNQNDRFLVSAWVNQLIKMKLESFAMILFLRKAQYVL